MTFSLSNSVARFSNLSLLAGPIFDKELRVSSRRKRNYFLRFAYLALLTVFVAFVWHFTVRSGGSASLVFQVSRTAEAGKYITTTVIWFQFVAVQLIAIVMLSNAVGEEIYHRTLGVLMTTPVSSFQIVIGKLFSKLLQLVLLLAISMPLLALIRVFGGVPWDYVLSGLCITLTAAIFAGSVSLLFSIYNRQAHSVILLSLSVCTIFYVAPLIQGLLQFAYPALSLPRWPLYYINPFIAMQSATELMLRPSSVAPIGSWLLHCAIMLGVSASLSALSVICVRRVGLRQATGEAGIFLTRKERYLADKKRRRGSDLTERPKRIMRVKGPPIVWKELVSVLAKTGRLRAIIGFVLGVCVLTAAYGFCVYFECLGSREVQTGFVLTYFFLGLLRTATSAATSITSEKEARTWPILLTTPLAEKRIVFSKIIGSCLQGWLFWSLLVVHVAVFSLARCIHLAAVLPLALLVITSALLVSAVGVFFSSCFRRSSISASVNLILFLGFAAPVCCPLPIFVVSPLFAAVAILGVTGGWNVTTPFVRPGSGWGGWLGTFLISWLALIVLVAIYLSLALAAFAVATSNIRRGIFSFGENRP